MEPVKARCWWYVPAWIGAQLPLLTLTAVVAGIVTLVAVLIRKRGPERLQLALPLVPIAIQAIVLPVLIVGTGAVLYDGIRHLLFMIPAMMAIPAVAVAALLERSRASSRLSIVLPSMAVVVTAASLFASIEWAPYAYAYLNPVAGKNPEGRSWQLDYWGVSGREGVERLRALGFAPVYVEPTNQVGDPWEAPPDQVPIVRKPGLYVFLRDKVRATDFGCTVVFTIKRAGHVLGEGARCPPQFDD
jgi:hypothetical protein